MQVLYVENPPNTFTPLTADLVTETATIPLSNFPLWDAAECAAVNVYVVAVPPVPANQQLVSSSVQRVSGVVQYSPVYATLVPDSVPMWCMQAVLTQQGMFTPIDAFVTSVQTTNPEVYFAWTKGNTVSRNSTLISAFAPQFGLTGPQIDAVFLASDAMSRGA